MGQRLRQRWIHAAAFPLVLAVVATGALWAAAARPGPSHDLPGAETAPAGADTTRIIVLGDTGTGAAGQHEVAAAVGQICALRGCDFAIINGDLIYETGVGGPFDPQFETKFERPYAPLDLRFHLTLGNHDNSDDLDGGLGTDSGKGDHLVAYHYRADTSGKWYLPARYYRAGASDRVDLFSLDTSTMMSYGFIRKGLDPVATVQGQDPLMVAQTEWMDSALDGSVAPWKIAFGHHPLYSNGEHGNAGSYESQGQKVGDASFPTTIGLGVKLFLEEHVCGRVDLYLAGHDHDLQWLQPAPTCGPTQLIISGAGAKTRELQDETRNPAYFQKGGTLGFFWLELRDSDLVGAVFDAQGRLLFEQTVGKPLAR